MRKVRWSLLASAACAALLAVPLMAAGKPAASAAAKDMKPAAAMRSAWPPETLSGKITIVEPNRKLMVIQAPDGTPFDMVITANTRIRSGDQTIAIKDLARDMNKTVSVNFIPERRGDVAKSIKIQG